MATLIPITRRDIMASIAAAAIIPFPSVRSRLERLHAEFRRLSEITTAEALTEAGDDALDHLWTVAHEIAQIPAARSDIHRAVLLDLTERSANRLLA